MATKSSKGSSNRGSNARGGSSSNNKKSASTTASSRSSKGATSSSQDPDTESGSSANGNETGNNGGNRSGSTSSERSSGSQTQRGGSAENDRMRGGYGEEVRYQQGRGVSNGYRMQGTDQGRHGTVKGRQEEGLMKLFKHQLMDLYYVEKQLLKALHKMADKAHGAELSEALSEHLNETEEQVERLEEVFEIVGLTARGKRCEAIDGILDEAKELMDEFKNDEALDAAIVCAAQKVEHYEITTYGSLCAFADELGFNEVCDLLEETLDEEKNADDRLSQLAEARINSSASRNNGRGNGNGRYEEERYRNGGGSQREQRREYAR